MRTLLICHDDAPLDREGLVRWLGSFSEFTGSIVIREPGSRLRKRVRRELTRVGPWRFLDVLAYRAYYRLVHAAADTRWETAALDRLEARYGERPDAPELIVSSPNSPEAERFIRDRRPDLVIARCKTLLKEQLFSIPPLGTFVMHPGICPEYRNAHGCFWALASGDAGNVGITLLRIDADPSRESPVVMQDRAVLDNLDAIRETLVDIDRGVARPVDTTGRRSAAWGQPWLSAYLRLRLRGRRLRTDLPRTGAGRALRAHLEQK